MNDELFINVKVLITSPSTNEADHIGGIATFTRLLIENNRGVNYIHFVRGREKNRRRRFAWLIKQPVLLLKFISTLIYTKNIKVVHINMPLEKYAILRDSILIIIASIFGKKVIVHFHGGKYSMNKFIPYYLKMLTNISIMLSSRIITLGNTEKQFIRNYYKVKPEFITPLGSAVKVREQVVCKMYDSIINILYLGRIERNKGLKEIILALKLLLKKYDIKLIIAGEGPDKDEFLRECEEQIPGKYEYLGVVSGPEKQKLLDKAHIFLMPSYYEGLPLSLLEAMANKIIPIVTPVGSIPEIVRDGYNGFMVPVHDYKTICERIIESIENPERMVEMGQNAYNIIKSEYSLTDYIYKINKIYSDLQHHV